jgi:hypothetical protein
MRISQSKLDAVLGVKALAAMGYAALEAPT